MPPLRREGVDEWLRRQLKSLNEGLPRSRKRLAELLEMDRPVVETVGGELHHFSREELERLARILPPDVATRLKLPLVFKRSFESGESIYFLDGGEAEAEAVKCIAGISFLPSAQGRYYTYKPIISKIASNYPSLIALGVT